MTVPAKYVGPEDVTLTRAMKDVVCGLKTLQNEQSRLDLRTGALVDQVEVTLNLKAAATGDSQLVVDAKPALPASAFASFGVTYTDKTQIVGERGNTIKITLKNMHTVQLNESGKKAAREANIPFDMGPGVYYPRDNPCEPLVLSERDLKGATRINDPVRRVSR